MQRCSDQASRGSILRKSGCGTFKGILELLFALFLGFCRHLLQVGRGPEAREPPLDGGFLLLVARYQVGGSDQAEPLGLPEQVLG